MPDWKLALLVLGASAAAGFPASASACPSCPTQLEARSDVARHEPLKWLLITVAPFAATGLVAMASYRIGRRGSER